MRSLTALLFCLAFGCASARPDAAVASARPHAPSSSSPPDVARANSGSDVAFANLTVAVRECRDGRKAREDLMRMYRGYQEHLDRRQQALATERAQIEARRARGEKVEAREAAFQSRAAEAHDEYDRLQKGLTEAEQRRADKIRDRLKAILREMARARGINELSDVDTPPTDGRHYIDLTTDVIRQADETR